ncbi:protein mono-ADP-ribosyltransferase PARP12-like isoform 2-T2 [Mantella aurantiaca]
MEGCIRNSETMWDPSLTISLTKLLCSHGGRLERNQLADFFDLSAEQIEQFLQDNLFRFPQSSQLVLAQSHLRICTQYLYPRDKEGCKEDCQKLHLCGLYLKGQCHFNPRYRCRFSHDILSVHNYAVLKANELSDLDEDEIKVLLFQNDSQLLLKDCPKYVHSICDQGEDCTRLHICRYFMRGACYHRICKKSHNLLESKLMLGCRWMSQQTIENFQILCDLKHSERHQELREKTNAETKESQQKSRALTEKTPVICLSNIWKFCKLGGKCSEMHYYLPYRWQEFNGTDWNDLTNMEDIEMTYSDPNNVSYRAVNFHTMKAGDKQVRRLSTPSSVTQPTEYVLTTEWIWYWKYELGTWTKYGQLNTKKVRSSILSSDLENIYLSDPTGTIQFTAANQNYIINFQEMRQRNVHYDTEKEVCRRPKFQDFEKVKMLKGSTKSSAVSANQKPQNSLLKAINYPPQWDINAMPEIGYQKVLVANSWLEFSNTVKMFKNTVSGQTVKNLWRIQNPTLWHVYQWQKDQMKKKNMGIPVDERQLFHGTDSDKTDAICKENFDWRVCGTNGVVYGQGSYFARDASYSHDYTSPTSEGIRTMFVARVLVGDFVKGDQKMRRPPQKYNSPERYDSCVNNIHDPSIFVVFEKFQVYPEYILEYEDEKKSYCVIG